jgi:Na+-transporting methylmalonyl-CoA/oxaloacetate decarboxylase beta subunit
MNDNIKTLLIVCATTIAIAVIIAGGVLLSQWMDIQETKNITLYLPGSCR